MTFWVKKTKVEVKNTHLCCLANSLQTLGDSLLHIVELGQQLLVLKQKRKKVLFSSLTSEEIFSGISISIQTLLDNGR